MALVSAVARAEEHAPPRWQIDVKAAYVVLGGDGAPATGGIMPSITGLHLWPVRDGVDLGIGAGIGLFGLGGDARWLGVLGGPAIAGRILPFHVPLAFELSTRLESRRRRCPRCVRQPPAL